MNGHHVWEDLPPLVQDSIEAHIMADGVEVPLWQERTSKKGARRPWCGCANRGPAWTLCLWHSGFLFAVEVLTLERGTES